MKPEGAAWILRQIEARYWLIRNAVTVRPKQDDRASAVSGAQAMKQ